MHFISPLTRKFKCNFNGCEKSYLHRNKMISHLRGHYLIFPFFCRFCQKKFKEKGNLKTHIRIHTGERPYVCSQCKRAFKAYGQLKEHKLSHTSLKPFQCPKCLKRFRRKATARRHMILHNKKQFNLGKVRERPFKICISDLTKNELENIKENKSLLWSSSSSTKIENFKHSNLFDEIAQNIQREMNKNEKVLYQSNSPYKSFLNASIFDTVSDNYLVNDDKKNLDFLIQAKSF